MVALHCPSLLRVLSSLNHKSKKNRKQKKITSSSSKQTPKLTRQQSLYGVGVKPARREKVEAAGRARPEQRRGAAAGGAGTFRALGPRCFPGGRGAVIRARARRERGPRRTGGRAAAGSSPQPERTAYCPMVAVSGRARAGGRRDTEVSGPHRSVSGRARPGPARRRRRRRRRGAGARPRGGAGAREGGRTAARGRAARGTLAGRQCPGGAGTPRWGRGGVPHARPRSSAGIAPSFPDATAAPCRVPAPPRPRQP